MLNANVAIRNPKLIDTRISSERVPINVEFPTAIIKEESISNKKLNTNPRWIALPTSCFEGKVLNFISPGNTTIGKGKFN